MRRRKDIKKGWTEEWKEFREARELWAWVCGKARKESTLYILAHNIHYDLAVSGGYRYLEEEGWDVEIPYAKGKVYIMKARKEKKKLIFLSTTNFFPTSVKEIGELIGKPKLSVDFDRCNMDELSRYCRRDVEIIRDAMLEYMEFVRENNFGEFAPTLSGQAWKAYRHKGMKTKIWVHGNEEALQMEREAFYGGRNECFYIGQVQEDEVYELDINSAYAYSMMVHEFPTNLVRCESNIPVSRIRKLLERYLVIADVLILTREPAYPLRFDGKVIYPVGAFRTVLATPELERALRCDDIVKIFRVAVYEKGRIFEGFIHEMIEMRKKYEAEGNLIYADIAKKMANSLYGKFAEQRFQWKLLGENEKEKWSYEEGWDEVHQERFRLVFWGKKVWLGTEPTLAPDAFPAIAAHITSYLRSLLWSYILLAGKENVIYCDTDSLIVNRTGKERLSRFLNDTEEGRLKVRKILRGLEIWGKKELLAENEVRLKGIPKTAQRIGEDTWEFELFPGVAMFLQKRAPSGYFTEKVIRTINHKYEYGEVQSDGRVRPFLCEYTGEGNKIISRTS